MDMKKIVKIGSYVIGGLGLVGGAIMSAITNKNSETEPNNNEEILEPDRID